MKELSETSGVPIPTIKFYLRERLLPAGDRTHPNQAEYSEDHLRRIRLVRALIDIGGMSVASARAVTAVLDLPGRSVHSVLGLVQQAMAVPAVATDDDQFSAARKTIDDLVDRLGWQVSSTNPGRDGAAAVLTTLASLDQPTLVGILEPYARAAEIAAAADLAAVAQSGATGRADAMVETAVIGMVVGETLTLQLRRMAQENASVQRLSSRHESRPTSSPTPTEQRHGH
ncbi:MerR family transcriptional regulator [Nakamurella sp. GG22]